MVLTVVRAGDNKKSSYRYCESEMCAHHSSLVSHTVKETRHTCL